MTSRTQSSTPAIQETIVRWLQIKENFRLITGSAGFDAPVVAGKKLKKKDAYASLAETINERNGTEFTGKHAEAKYLWLLGKFKKAKELSKTEDDLEKLQKVCSFYKELDELYGQRQNINPSNIFEPAPPPAPIQIPGRNGEVVDDGDPDENLLSSSLESVHLVDGPPNETPNDKSKKRKNDEVEDQPPESPTKKKQATPKKKETSSDEKESPFNSKSNSSGKKDFTTSYIASQKERMVMEKDRFEKEFEIKEKEFEFKQKELQLHKARSDKEVEIKEKEVEFKHQELQLHKVKIDKEAEIKEKEIELTSASRKEELHLKKMELEANIELRKKEMETQENIKKEEVKQTKMQLVKEMLSQGKSQEEIKELLEWLK